MIKEKKNQKTQKLADSCLPDCIVMQTIPSSPPPSYEHCSLQEAGQSFDHSETVTDEENCAGSSNQTYGPIVDCHNNQQSPVRQEIFHKSSKQFYKAVAAQWGITCKMSDHCRCLDCQSRYFDCEYDQENEQVKSDGGLGAGTPMFLSEVMHGSTCTLI